MTLADITLTGSRFNKAVLLSPASAKISKSLLFCHPEGHLLLIEVGILRIVSVSLGRH